jgi:hypothetical protein
MPARRANLETGIRCAALRASRSAKDIGNVLGPFLPDPQLHHLLGQRETGRATLNQPE